MHLDFKTAKRRLRAFDCLVLSLLLCAVQAAASELSLVELSRSKLPNGSLLVLKIKSEARPFGVFEGLKFPFYKSEKGGEYEALFGVPFNHRLGKAVLEIHAGDTIKEVPFEIVDGGYSSETLTVPEKHLNPTKEDLKRIRKEQREVRKIYLSSKREKFWKGKFVYPLQSVVTSPYGNKRLFNGLLQSAHQGIDLRAPIGTPIIASADGVVRLSKDMFFSGNTVILDHGYGLFSIYAHMSELKVKPGQRVKSGELLGLSGMTGRASGPHLHWGVTLHRQKINPTDTVVNL